MDRVLAMLEALMRHHGVYHRKLHFSSSRITLWHVDDPYSYQLHGPDQIAETDLCLSYPQHPYPDRAVIAPQGIRSVVEHLRRLRDMDDTIYLRSGSLNVINGMIGLNFSCDGMHYMSVHELISKDLEFWLGEPRPAGQTRRALNGC